MTHIGYSSLEFYIILQYFIILDKNNSIKRSHSNWERQSGRGVSWQNTPETCTGTNKGSFFSYKQVMVIMNDLELPMLSYYMIYYKSSEKLCSEHRMKL